MQMSGRAREWANWFDEDPPKKRAIGETELRTIAQEGVRNSQIAYRSEVIAQGRAIDPHGFGHYCAAAITSDLFGEGDQALAELELNKRQIAAVIAEKSKEAALLQQMVAPWKTLRDRNAEAFKRELESEGFCMSRAHRDMRLKRIAEMDELRASLANEFREIDQLNTDVRSLKNELRGVEVEIKIVKAKSRRKAK
jgi:hypothetical protein